MLPSAPETGMEAAARFLPLSLTNWFSHHLSHVLGLHADKLAAKKLGMERAEESFKRMLQGGLRASLPIARWAKPILDREFRFS